MGCNPTKIRLSVANVSQSNDVKQKSESLNEFNEQHSLVVVSNVSIDLSPIDNNAFSTIVCQQRQKAIDNMTYRTAIDTWRPSSIEELISSIQELSAHENQIDRAWIIFYWISQNISYNTDAFFSNQIETQNAHTIFQSGKAVCEGYSSLYTELCNRSGIQCRNVSGYGKGFGFDVRQTNFDKTNHAWNIITLNNGHSYFIESTWGSGHVDHLTHQYKKQLVPHYFLCRPEHMIYKHLPIDDECQLLAHPITMKQYLMLPYIYPAFFTFDLHIISPVHSAKVDLIKDKSYGLVLIQTSNNNIELSGYLEDEAGNKIQGGHFIYLDKKDQTLWRCQFAPPKPGKYNIIIFAGEKNHQDQCFSAAAVQFAFDVDHLPSSPISYPHIWSYFFDYNIEIIKPMNSHYIDWSSNINTPYCEIQVRSSDDVRISAVMKDSSTSTNVKNGTLVNFDHEADVWQCLFAPSTIGIPFELTLFAKRQNENESHPVTQFVLQPIPSNALKECMIFPEIYLPFYNMRCHLIEPLNGVLQSDSTVHFRCRIPGAQEINITVDDNWIEGDAWKPDENNIFDGDIQVGQKEVAIYVKFNDENSSYQGLLKYTTS
ncbi:unnamed protein product [Rotaria sordida]|uniref:Transglutaminase-like domain-containing protein n=1 Tax=Rotaria sordida TaxID=392033 RepID=A0A818QW09_9BILA|nr:unnamed protein product [Rotaria sordida]CAF3642920.1 unnamed protein product [Rotaria sordida]